MNHSAQSQPITSEPDENTSVNTFPTDFNDWFVVQCKPRQEYRARDNIRNQSGEAMLFERPVEKIRSGKRVKTQELWFPGYVFAKLPPEHLLWSTIRSTLGVIKVVRFGERPTPLRPEVFKQICDAVQTVSLKPRFKPGDKVQIQNGPLAGFDAIFTAYDGTMRAVLLINLLHRAQTAKIPLEDLAH